MKKFLSTIAVTSVCATLAHAAPQTQQTSSRTKSAEPQGFVLVEEQVSIDMNALPMVLLSDARTDFSNRNFGEASGDLKAASRLLNAEGRQTKNTVASSELDKARTQLDQLASDVRAGKVDSARALDGRLSQILSMKSQADQQRASAKWGTSEFKAVGYNLQLAADEIEQAAKWAGQKIDSASSSSIADARRIGGKLIEGSNWTQEEVRTLLDNFRSASERISQNLTNQGTSSATTQSAAPQTK